MAAEPEAKAAPSPSALPERFSGLRRGLLAASRRFEYQSGSRASISAAMASRTGGPLTIGRRFNPGPGADYAGLSAVRPGRIYTLYFLKPSSRTAEGINKPVSRYQLETDVLVTLAAIAACSPQPTKENSWGLGATVFMGATGADVVKTNTAIAGAECRMEPVEIGSEAMNILIDAMEAHAEEGSDETLAELVEAAAGLNEFFDDDSRALVEEFADVLVDSHYQLTQSIMATFVNAVLKDSTPEIYGPYIRKRARGNEAVALPRAGPIHGTADKAPVPGI